MPAQFKNLVRETGQLLHLQLAVAKRAQNRAAAGRSRSKAKNEICSIGSVRFMPSARSSRYGNTPQQRTCSFSVHTFWPDRLQCLPGQVIPRDKRIRRNALRQRKKRIRACFNRLPLLSEAVEAEQIYHIIWNRHLQIVIFSL